MSQAKPDQPVALSPHRRTFVVLLFITGLTAAVAVAYWFARPIAPAPPPTLDFTQMDPAVARAVADARDHVLKSPRSADAWGNLGMVLLGHQFRPEAADCFTRAERLADKEARWPYLHAAAVQRTDPETAVADLRRALERGGDDAGVARLRLADLLLEQGKLDEAESEFQEALKANPDEARAHLGLARVEIQRDDPTASLAHLERAATDRHARKASALLSAEAHQRLGDAAAAERDLHTANELPADPVWPDPLVQEASGAATGQLVLLARANQMLMEDRVPEAATLLQQILHDYPDADRAWFLLGKALMRANNLPGAETALREATRLAPAADEYQYDLGTVLFSRQQPAAAAECFRKATELKPDFARAYYNLGHCLKQLGDRDGAITAFRNALRSEPRLAAAHANLGELLAQAGRTDEALRELREAVRWGPDDAHARELLDALQKRLGEPSGLGRP